MTTEELILYYFALGIIGFAFLALIFLAGRK